MGATASRTQDASLGLAVPKHSSIGGRRILDPTATRCAVCDSLFLPLIRKKHYCRRCGAIICDECSVMRHYKQRDGGWLFRVCTRCNVRPSIFDLLVPGERPWRLVMEFAGDLSQHRVLQVCHRSQLSYQLPYAWSSWEDLFAEQQFLAKGANGAVYRAMLRSAFAQRHNVPRGGPVAVKVIQKNSIYSLRKWSHIQRELDTLRICKHPHVINLVDVFQSTDAVFIILEYAQGGDLFDWLVARRKPKESEVRAIAVQLLGTIFLMHEKFGVVHRDIKPENILLKERPRGRNDEPHVLFADFGFARRYPVRPDQLLNSLVGPGAQSALLAAIASSGIRINNSSGGGAFGGGSSLGAPGESFDPSNFLLNATPCGTLGFAPPEVIQAYNARKADPTSQPAAPSTPIDTMKKMDIFALGITLAILLTGQEPFPVHSSRAHVEAVQRGVNFNSRPWQYVSGPAKNLLRRMLAARSEDRPHALECLQSEWFEGASAAGFDRENQHHHLLLHNAKQAPPPPQESEEDVRTFQKSVRSLRNRPDMVYVHTKDGAGVSMSSKTQAKLQEEEHIAEEENLQQHGDDLIAISASHSPDNKMMPLLSGSMTPSKGILKSSNQNQNNQNNQQQQQSYSNHNSNNNNFSMNNNNNSSQSINNSGANHSSKSVNFGQVQERPPLAPRQIGGAGAGGFMKQQNQNNNNDDDDEGYSNEELQTPPTNSVN
jgi:serine/threonine protein kinase